jgi:hypothetical protein
METPKKQRERRDKALDALIDILYQEVAADLQGFYDSGKFANSILRRTMRDELKKTLGEVNLDILNSRLTFEALWKKGNAKNVGDRELSDVVHTVRKEFRDASGLNEIDK